jgi:hypothetical protein
MNPTAVYSKSGKGVQEAAGKTSLLQRSDRVVLAAIDGRATLADVAQKIGKSFDAAFQGVITQLDKNGFIREVSAGAAAPASKPAGPVSRPGPVPAKPAAKAEQGFGDLDFSSLGGGKPPSAGRPAAAPPPPKPAAPPPPPPAFLDQTTVLAKAREEAEAKAAADRERLKKEAEAKARAEMEAKARAEAEQKMKEEAEAKAKAEAEAKVKAAREAAARAEAEAKAKLDAERKAREELERRLEAERKAREEAERKAKEEAERARKEAEEKARLEAERKAREEAERKAKEEAERVRRELEEERKRLEAQRKREEAARERERQEAEARRAAEEAAKAKAQAEAAAAAAVAAATAAATPPPAPKAAQKGASFADSLLADLESFTNREDEERKKDEAEHKAKAEAARRAREEADRKAAEEAEAARHAEEEERRVAEEAQRVREEEERRAQEEERRKREAEEIRRKAEAATAAAMAKEGRQVAKPAEEDIPITDDDLDMDEVKREQAALAKVKAKEEKKEKEREKERERAARKAKSVAAAPARERRPVKWGKPVAVTLVLLLVAAIGAAHVMPLDTADYERAASEALGRPVKIGSAGLWLFSGLPQVRFRDVRIGDARIAQVNASGLPGAIFGDKKEFSEIQLDGFTLPQDSIGNALFARVRGDKFSVSRVSIKSLQLPGPATLPKDLYADIGFDAGGTLQSATLRGPDSLVAKLMPKGGAIDFEVVAAGFTLPIAPQITLSNFAMKGRATPRGMTISEWGGAIFNGGISGTANVNWGGGWTVDGVVTVRNINAAVFAPALLSSGNGEGTGKFSMSAPDPAGLVSASRIDGNFTVSKGTLGSFDLARAIQSGGKQANGSTQFAEMNGQATYDRGAVALRNVTIGAGALNAGASADIARNGALSGRIVADMKTASEMLRATLMIGGTVKEPQVRN